MRTLALVKYEGLGNDFLVADAETESALTPSDASWLCDRHFGVGADGVILVLPAERSDARMVVLNADGSRPEMCGNGLRCVAYHVASRSRPLSPQVRLATDAGDLSCDVRPEVAGAIVTAELGTGVPAETLEVEHDGRALSFARVSMGNPHAVLFTDPWSDSAIDAFAPRVCAAVPGGTNVEFATIRDAGHIDLVVWERGVGRTLACGTGAGATVVAAALVDRVGFDAPVRVNLPGGPLDIVVARSSLRVTMSGPARRVFTCQVELP